MTNQRQPIGCEKLWATIGLQPNIFDEPINPDKFAVDAELLSALREELKSSDQILVCFDLLMSLERARDIIGTIALFCHSDGYRFVQSIQGDLIFWKGELLDNIRMNKGILIFSKNPSK